MMSITLGSTSEHKISAVVAACEKLELLTTITPIKAASRVNEQPYELPEIYKGALRRALAASHASKARRAISIGIESGIVKIMENQYLDIAVIVVITSLGREIITTSAGVAFPAEYVNMALKKGFETTTVGSKIAEKLGGDSTDPHATLTNGKITRHETLVDALVVALKQI